MLPPKFHGGDHHYLGPDPIPYPVAVTSDDGSVDVSWTDEHTVDLAVAPSGIYVPPSAQREEISGSYSVAGGSTIDLAHAGGAVTLFDYSSPTNIKPLVSGVYAINWDIIVGSLGIPPPANGDVVVFELVLSGGGGSRITFEQTSGGYQVIPTACNVMWMDDTDDLSVSIGASTGGSLAGTVQLWVTRIT